MLIIIFWAHLWNCWKSQEHSPNVWKISLSCKPSHNVLLWNSSCTMCPMLYKVVPFGICLYHTSGKCHVGSGTFLSFPLDLDGFPAPPLFLLPPLFAELWNFPLDFGFPFLGSLSILNIIDLGNVLHSVNMSLCANFQS